MSWVEFENNARHAIEKEIRVTLSSIQVDINGKTKKFDLVNIEKRIIGDIKNYKTTEGGNRPSAKFSIINEYVWQMQLLERYSNQKWRKILVMGEDLDMVIKYTKEFDKWLDDIEIYFFSRTTGVRKIR